MENNIISLSDMSYIRKVDKFGRIVIPAAFKRSIKNDGFFVMPTGERIVLTPHNRGEAFDKDAMILYLDELNRICLPLFIAKSRAYNISVQENNIILDPAHISCIFCGASPEEHDNMNTMIYEYREKYLCSDCLNEIINGHGNAVSCETALHINDVNNE